MFDFPGNPNLNDEYHSSTGLVFVWNGYAWIMKTGPWGGDVTLVSGANGIITVPSPIVSTGSVELEVPVTVARGGTGAINAASARTNLGAVSLAGDTMTGDLTIAAATPSLRLNKSVGQANNIYGLRAGIARWVIVPGSNAAETGTGNAGSDFLIGRYTDAGVLIDFPLTIVRSTGEAQLIYLALSGNDPMNGSATNRALVYSNTFRFRRDSADETNAGAIGYKTFDATALSIVGAGTTGTNRKVRVFDNLDVSGNVSLNTGGNIYLLNSACLAVYDTGNAVARQAVIMDGSNYMLFGDPNRYTTIRSGGVIALQGAVNITGAISTSNNLSVNEVIMSGAAIYFRGGSWPNGPYILNDGSNWIAKGGGFHVQNSSGGTYGAFNTSGQVCSLGARPIAYNDGSTAIIYRSMDTTYWMYYSSNSTASYHAEVHYFRNWNGTVEFAHIASDGVSTSRVITSRMDIYGGVFYNGYNDNWLYFNGSLRVYDFNSQNNVSANGRFYLPNGHYLQYWNGYTDTGQQFHSGSNIVAEGSLTSNNGLVYLAGMYWQNNAGWMYCPWGIRSDGSIQSGNDLNHTGVVRCYGGAGRGARIENQGWDYDWITFFYSGGAQYSSPDRTGGPVYINDTWWCDSRLKRNLRNSEIDALGAIVATPMWSYELNDEGRRLVPWIDPDIKLGFTAEEIRETIPTAVMWSEPYGYNLLNTQNITPYLFRAVQQLAEINAKLEARIAQLEAR